MADKSVKCLVCNDMFSKRSNMYAHMRNIHKMKGETDPVVRKIRKKTKLCTDCEKAFTTKHNLHRHMQKLHNGGVCASHTTRIKCPVSGCEHTFTAYTGLRDHLVELHEKQLLVEDLVFESEKGFLVWKEDMQTKTLSLYVADTSKKSMKDGTQKQYYNCHRSYKYRGSGQNKRRLKSAGSMKIGTTCPARLEMTIKNELLYVKFWKTHVGHNMDLEHINLSKAARIEIAEKMKQGEPFQQILNDIHVGQLCCLDPQRARMVKRKDLHNIYRDFHIGSVIKQFKNEPNEGEDFKEDRKVENLQNITPVHICVDNPKHGGSFQEIFNDMKNETLQTDEPVENCVNSKEIQENLLNRCSGIPSDLEENVHSDTVTNIEDIHQLTVNGPILFFEDQNFQTPTVIQLTGDNHEYSVMYYEEVGVEDCTISDPEIIHEKEQNDLPIIYHEEIIPENCETADRAVKDNPKSYDIGCPDCGQMFTKRKNLYAHMRNIHKLTGVNDPVCQRKCSKNEICPKCGKGFLNKVTLRRHRQKVHHEGTVNSHLPRIRCPELKCEEIFVSYSHLREHLLSSHQKELELQEMHFELESDFQQWRDKIQAETLSFYVLDTSRKVMKDGAVKMYYNCHRSYSYKSTGRNIRKLKTSGSNKMGRTCPSRLEVIIKIGDLDVKFWKTHLGHSVDVGYTTLSKAVRSEIAEMLKQGATFEHILDLTRNGKLQANLSQRTPLIKRKDLHNICRDFHISLSPAQSSGEIDDNWCPQVYQDR